MKLDPKDINPKELGPPRETIGTFEHDVELARQQWLLDAGLVKRVVVPWDSPRPVTFWWHDAGCNYWSWHNDGCTRFFTQTNPKLRRRDDYAEAWANIEAEIAAYEAKKKP